MFITNIHRLKIVVCDSVKCDNSLQKHTMEVVVLLTFNDDSLLRYFGKTETEPVGRICICLFNALLKSIQHSNITQTNFKYLMMKFHCENPINFIPIFLILIEVIAIKTFFSQLSDSFEWK